MDSDNPKDNEDDKEPVYLYENLFLIKTLLSNILFLVPVTNSWTQNHVMNSMKYEKKPKKRKQESSNLLKRINI